MRKADLITAVAEEQGLTYVKAEEAVNSNSSAKFEYTLLGLSVSEM
jgi:nucleoid DNA-binding protein